jgi:hypothetical protein
MKRSSWLARLAFLVWAAWLALVGLVLGMVRLRIWHPHFLPVTAALALLVAAALALFVAGASRLIRAPRRVGALSCLLVGLTPSAVLAGYVMFGFGIGYGRQYDRNLALRSLVPFGESILDFVVRFSYPQRPEGERVVMISAPITEETARRQVAAMDRHIRTLESRLGRTGKRRVYWVRGPILGLGGKAIDSMCIGSRAGE